MTWKHVETSVEAGLTEIKIAAPMVADGDTFDHSTPRSHID